MAVRKNGNDDVRKSSCFCQKLCSREQFYSKIENGTERGQTEDTEKLEYDAEIFFHEMYDTN